MNGELGKPSEINVALICIGYITRGRSLRDLHTLRP